MRPPLFYARVWKWFECPQRLHVLKFNPHCDALRDWKQSNCAVSIWDLLASEEIISVTESEQVYKERDQKVNDIHTYYLLPYDVLHHHLTLTARRPSLDEATDTAPPELRKNKSLFFKSSLSQVIFNVVTRNRKDTIH